MSELFKSNSQIQHKIKETSTKAHLSNTSLKASKHNYSGGTDIMEKETCSQSTRNIITINLTTEELQSVNNQNSFLSQKRYKKRDIDQDYYRKAQKLKIQSLQNEKAALLDEIAFISKKNIESLFTLMPQSLSKFQDIIVPSSLSLMNTEGCNEYVEYLTTQIET